MTFMEVDSTTCMAKWNTTITYTNPNLYILVILILTLAYTIRRISNRLAQDQHHCQLSKAHNCLPAPTYPHKEPLLGLDLVTRTFKALQNHSYLPLRQSIFQSIGDTYISLSIGRRAINTNEPANIKTILSTNFSDYVYGSPYSDRRRFRRLMGEGLMTTDGAAWKHSRGLLQRCIKRGSEERNLRVFERHVQSMLARIPSRTQSNPADEVDLKPLFYAFTMETALDLFVGESRPLAFGDRAISAFTKAFDRGLRTATVDFGLGPLTEWSSHAPWRLRKDRLLLEGFIDGYVREALARSVAPLATPGTEEKCFEWSGGSGSLFLDELVQQTRDPVKLRAELMFVMVAARDTTAGLLSNLWFVLGQRTEVFEKLRKEVLETFEKGERIDGARLDRMPFLRSCINESLRLHPPIPFGSKVSIRDTILPLGGGPDGKSPLLVPANTAVGFSMYAMHRRQDLWGADAEEFRPERWEDGKQRGWQFLPFNGGPRICLGQKLAMAEVSYVTVRLMQEIEKLEGVEVRGWREEINLTLGSGGGVRVRAVRA